MKVFSVQRDVEVVWLQTDTITSQGPPVKYFCSGQRTQRGWLGQIDFQMLTLSWKEPEQTEKRPDNVT